MIKEVSKGIGEFLGRAGIYPSFGPARRGNFPGLKILLKRYAVGLDEMKERAARLADDYNLLINYIEAEERYAFDAKLRGRIKRVDQSATGADRERAATLVHKIVTLAKARMLFSYDEDDRAVSASKPILNAKDRSSEAAR